MKKFLAILLSTVLVVSMLAAIAPASAASTNVALNAKYTISGSGKVQGTNWTANLTDGVASDEVGDARWENVWFSFGSDHKDTKNYAWVILDLKKNYKITEVRVHFGNAGDGGVASGENTLWTSEDGENWIPYGEAFRTADIAVGTTEWLGVKKESTGRYVKFQLNIWAVWSTFFNEIEVYADGEIKPEPKPEGTNLAKGLTVKHSLTDGSYTDKASGKWNANLTDGKSFKALDDSVWSDAGEGTWFGLNSAYDVTDNYAHLVLDLGKVADISTVRIYAGEFADWGIAKPLEVYLGFSTNGTDYEWFDLKSSLQSGCYWLTTEVSTQAQYVQYKIYLQGSWAFFNELEVYGAWAGSTDVPSEDDSSEDSSVEDSSVEDSSVVDSSVEDSSVEDSSVEDSSVEDSSVVESSEASKEESKKPSTPAAGDASNMLMFAVIALVAIAGSAVVIKTRR